MSKRKSQKAVNVQVVVDSPVVADLFAAFANDDAPVVAPEMTLPSDIITPGYVVNDEFKGFSRAVPLNDVFSAFRIVRETEKFDVLPVTPGFKIGAGAVYVAANGTVNTLQGFCQ